MPASVRLASISKNDRELRIGTARELFSGMNVADQDAHYKLAVLWDQAAGHAGATLSHAHQATAL